MLKTYSWTLSNVQDEVRALVDKGSVNRSQPLYELCQYFSDREWHPIELLLESHGYLLRDQIGDLMPCEHWLND